MESLADLNVAEHGRHPAVWLWKRLAREALQRMWSERRAVHRAAVAQRGALADHGDEPDGRGRAARPPTGLGNRHMMASTVDRAGEDLAAVFIDVDEFKQVNDRYSHAVGDEVLRRIAAILRRHSRFNDVPVRYGGDEFVILVFGGGAAAKEVAERLHDAVRAAPWDRSPSASR